MGHWRSRPHRMGATPQLREAEVGEIPVRAALLKKAVSLNWSIKMIICIFIIFSEVNRTAQPGGTLGVDPHFS